MTKASSKPFRRAAAQRSLQSVVIRVAELILILNRRRAELRLKTPRDLRNSRHQNAGRNGRVDVVAQA